MITTAIIAFREFLEAFLIVGVFLGISRKLKLKREIEISLAAGTGLVISLILASATYIFGDLARGILTEHNADILQSYLLIFSGIFIAYVVFSLHNLLRYKRGASILKIHEKLQKKVFDFSLFITIMFLVIREGFEIALFTATTSLFAAFLQNFLGLILGFSVASIIGLATFLAYIRFPIGKVFKITEYMIILLGASLVQNGITKITEVYFNIHLSKILPLPVKFIPNYETTFTGHVVKNLFGVDNEFSLIRLLIMVFYIGLIYILFIRRKKLSIQK
ncbi:FTR1 family protein [Candidatus Gottesmanbacteria bacterium]|nr:FTR1 family protein [Candidatus Gottesmanbacteria bacterium]